MFSSLWLIADNDVWEVCQTGEHTGLPSGAGPRSGCVHLTNEMSRREDGATKRSLQTNFPPALDCTNSLKFSRELAWSANWPHTSRSSFFRDVWPWGSSQVCFGSEALPFVVYSSYWWSYWVHRTYWWSHRSTQCSRWSTPLFSL